MNSPKHRHYTEACSISHGCFPGKGALVIRVCGTEAPVAAAAGHCVYPRVENMGGRGTVTGMKDGIAHGYGARTAQRRC